MICAAAAVRKRGLNFISPDVKLRPVSETVSRYLLWAKESERKPERKGKKEMKRIFTASVWPEGDWFVAQCLEVDIASQGKTEQEAVASLREALELYFEPPCATATPQIQKVEVEVSAA